MDQAELLESSMTKASSKSFEVHQKMLETRLMVQAAKLAREKLTEKGTRDWRKRPDRHKNARDRVNQWVNETRKVAETLKKVGIVCKCTKMILCRLHCITRIKGTFIIRTNARTITIAMFRAGPERY